MYYIVPSGEFCGILSTILYISKNILTPKTTKQEENVFLNLSIYWYNS